MSAIEITLCHWANHCKEYVAKITGLDPKFGLSRQFQRASERRWSRSGKQGDTVFVVCDPGFYEIQEPATGVYGSKGARRWFHLSESGEATSVSEAEVYAAFGKPIQKVNKVSI